MNVEETRTVCFRDFEIHITGQTIYEICKKMIRINSINSHFLINESGFHQYQVSSTIIALLLKRIYIHVYELN